MKSTLFPLLALLLASSCTIRLYTDDKLVRKVKGTRSHEPAMNDSCFVLGQSANIPAGALYVNNTRLRTSTFCFFGEQPAAGLLIRQAEEEARNDGANVIVVYEESRTPNPPYFVKTQFYRLQGAALIAYRRRLDSLNSHTATVHVINWFQRKPIPLYLDDSLVGSCPPAVYYRGLRRSQWDFIFSRSGNLCIHAAGSDRVSSSFHIEPGKEYRLDINTDDHMDPALFGVVIPRPERINQ